MIASPDSSSIRMLKARAAEKAKHIFGDFETGTTGFHVDLKGNSQHGGLFHRAHRFQNGGQLGMARFDLPARREKAGKNERYGDFLDCGSEAGIWRMPS
jgi:hypothetical protein